MVPTEPSQRPWKLSIDIPGYDAQSAGARLAKREQRARDAAKPAPQPAPQQASDAEFDELNQALRGPTEGAP